ncbi:unnamed protein product, partial [Ectocarpus sp. 4 AP-2014]
RPSYRRCRRYRHSPPLYRSSSFRRRRPRSQRGGGSSRPFRGSLRRRFRWPGPRGATAPYPSPPPSPDCLAATAGRPDFGRLFFPRFDASRPRAAANSSSSPR